MVLVLVWRQRTEPCNRRANFCTLQSQSACKSRTGGGFHELFECLQIQKKLRRGRCTGRTNGATLCASQLAWSSYVAVLQSVPIRPRCSCHHVMEMDDRRRLASSSSSSPTRLFSQFGSDALRQRRIQRRSSTTSIVVLPAADRY